MENVSRPAAVPVAPQRPGRQHAEGSSAGGTAPSGFSPLARRIAFSGDCGSLSCVREQLDRESFAPASARVQRKADAPAGVDRAVPAIVDDTDPAAAGQMRRAEFLARLRSALTSTCDRVLASVGRTTGGCPYIQHWLGVYERKPAAALLRAVRRYAGAPPRADAYGLLAAAIARVGGAVRTWVSTGRIGGLPAQAGAGEEKEGPVAGLLQAKQEVSDGGAVHDAAEVQARLGPGRSLDVGLRSRMERAYGGSFADVRVHTDVVAAELNRSLRLHRRPRHRLRGGPVQAELACRRSVDRARAGPRGPAAWCQVGHRPRVGARGGPGGGARHRGRSWLGGDLVATHRARAPSLRAAPRVLLLAASAPEPAAQADRGVQEARLARSALPACQRAAIPAAAVRPRASSSRRCRTGELVWVAGGIAAAGSGRRGGRSARTCRADPSRCAAAGRRAAARGPTAGRAADLGSAAPPRRGSGRRRRGRGGGNAGARGARGARHALGRVHQPPRRVPRARLVEAARRRTDALHR